MNKSQIAEILEDIANLLEIQGENSFKIRAYRNAARSLLNLDQDLSDLMKKGQLTEIEGIGESIAEKIEQLLKKGKLPFYEKLKKSIPQSVIEMTNVSGIGPRKAQILYKKLKIRKIQDLVKACEKGKVAKIKGFGKRTESKILNAIGQKNNVEKRHLWIDAMAIADPILKKLKKLKGVKKGEIAGSLRRKLETIGDLDFLVASSEPKSVMKWFTEQDCVKEILAKGETKSSILLKEGIQADLRIVSEKEFPFALCYFTGSKEHNVVLRKRAISRSMILNEYALKSKKKSIPIKTEKELYRALDLKYIEPELRENMGEFVAAEKNKLPKLIEDKDIKGSFHIHTAASDGKNSLKEMVQGAEQLGWEYIGISDHSKSSFQANGLSIERLEHQIDEIIKLNRSKKFKPFIFAGTECDVLKNGSLDFPDSVLERLDFVIVSIHSSFSQSEASMTKRLIKAIEHPKTTIVGHLTGRLLLERAGYKINVQKIIDACIANEVVIEINGNPLRLDMDWRFWHKAKDKGLFCSINPDAHSVDGLEFVKTGLNIARKGWLEKENVINTYSLAKMKKFLLP